MIRVLLVDDEPILRLGVRMFLRKEADIQVCGEAADVSAAKSAMETLHPDVAVVDLVLRDADGFDLIAWIRRHQPHLKILVLSMHNATSVVDRALRGGAHGYVAKEDGTSELVPAIRAVTRNRRYLSSSVGGEMGLSPMPGSAQPPL